MEMTVPISAVVTGTVRIVAPKAGKLGGWTPSEAVFVKDAVDDFKDDYAIDPARVFLHSFDDGNTLAFQMAFKYRDQFRGVCAMSAPMRARPVENSPDYRLQFHFVCGDQDRMNIRQVARTVSALRGLKFPVSSTTVKGLGHDYPTTKDQGEILREIARWADCLDRI